MKTSSLFAQSRRRIIAAIMAVLVTLFVATLAAIYAFSYAEVYDRNTHMLENYAANYQANRLPSGFVRPDNLRQRQFESPSHSAPFYAVLFDANGSVVSVESINANGYTVGDLVGFAHNALDKNERSGLEGSLMFAVERTAGYTLVAFMDNTLVTESMGTLFRYTLIVGLVMLVLLFFVARWLAGRIVRPMQQAYEAQRRFISDAGHELKTPVAVMEANAELLQREVGDNPWLANIRHENEQMGVLVTQLLELARTESNAMTREKVDLSRLVEAECLSHEPVAFERDHAARKQDFGRRRGQGQRARAFASCRHTARQCHKPWSGKHDSGAIACSRRSQRADLGKQRDRARRHRAPERRQALRTLYAR